MKTPFALAIMTLIFLASPEPSTAQTATAEVTVKVPVNLTQFGPDVAKVRVNCELHSVALTNGTGRTISGSGGVNPEQYLNRSQETPISGAQVNTTVSLLFSAALDNPTGKTATVSCRLEGWSTSAQTWTEFSPFAVNPSFKVSSTSKTLENTGFNW